MPVQWTIRPQKNSDFTLITLWVFSQEELAAVAEKIRARVNVK